MTYDRTASSAAELDPAVGWSSLLLDNAESSLPMHVGVPAEPWILRSVWAPRARKVEAIGMLPAQPVCPSHHERRTPDLLQRTCEVQRSAPLRIDER